MHACKIYFHQVLPSILTMTARNKGILISVPVYPHVNPAVSAESFVIYID